jgi:hypothetical protein
MEGRRTSAVTRPQSLAAAHQSCTEREELGARPAQLGFPARTCTHASGQQLRSSAPLLDGGRWAWEASAGLVCVPMRAHATWRGSPQRFAVATHLCVAFAHPQGGLQQCSDGLVGPAVTASACVLPAPFWRAYTAEDAGRACTIPASHGFAFDPIRALPVRHALTRSATRNRGVVWQLPPPRQRGGLRLHTRVHM